ncbi:hypothetical protein QQS45_06540 [Alteriqipengyuania flavescens]|uniref:hypothetical protein n=1 Tax=Alteriqipengyuania flavescens TaxID=3053610 RepID=UPI0025B5FDC8|nr:hypothetical protein [Alteriqipengyuania flavescens]WJY19867.1 hypothetical protein QQW98_06535 [Alteriqipengyuania flavescens]WJY25809.1 hypothetical protein QQS45_06540 [Alteriqipengyuania flavescens]
MEQKFTHASGNDLEQLASQLDRTLTLLANTEARLAGPIITPGETRFRDPHDVHHQITLGAVLCAYKLNAHHARAIDGLLSMTVEQMKAILEEASSIEGDDDDDEDEDETMGTVLLKLVELVPGRLDEFGRYAEWRRGFDAYMDRTRPYLEDMTAEDLEKLETRPPSQNQMRQIRVTCAYHRIPFPAVPNRRTAFEWLRDFGANTRYRELPR